MSRSVWNNAGTWEEKDCTEWACGSVKDMLSSAATDGASVVSVKKVKGECVGPTPHSHRCRRSPPLHTRTTPLGGRTMLRLLKIGLVNLFAMSTAIPLDDSVDK
jgi:hypothetical protein